MPSVAEEDFCIKAATSNRSVVRTDLSFGNSLCMARILAGLLLATAAVNAAPHFSTLPPVDEDVTKSRESDARATGQR